MSYVPLSHVGFLFLHRLELNSSTKLYSKYAASLNHLLNMICHSLFSLLMESCRNCTDLNHFLEKHEQGGIFCNGNVGISKFENTLKSLNLKSNFRNLEFDLLQIWNASPGVELQSELAARSLGFSVAVYTALAFTASALPFFYHQLILANVPKRWQIWSNLPEFRGLVLGYIVTDFCK